MALSKGLQNMNFQGVYVCCNSCIDAGKQHYDLQAKTLLLMTLGAVCHQLSPCNIVRTWRKQFFTALKTIKSACGLLVVNNIVDKFWVIAELLKSSNGPKNLGAPLPLIQEAGSSP
jgi:hypothetical protein